MRASDGPAAGVAPGRRGVAIPDAERSGPVRELHAGCAQCARSTRPCSALPPSGREMVGMIVGMMGMVRSASSRRTSARPRASFIRCATSADIEFAEPHSPRTFRAPRAPVPPPVVPLDTDHRTRIRTDPATAVSRARSPLHHGGLRPQRGSRAARRPDRAAAVGPVAGRFRVRAQGPDPVPGAGVRRTAPDANRRGTAHGAVATAITRGDS